MREISVGEKFHQRRLPSHEEGDWIARVIFEQRQVPGFDFEKIRCNQSPLHSEFETHGSDFLFKKIAAVTWLYHLRLTRNAHHSKSIRELSQHIAGATQVRPSFGSHNGIDDCAVRSSAIERNDESRRFGFRYQFGRRVRQSRRARARSFHDCEVRK